MFVKNDLGQWVPAHPGLAAHDTMGLATQAELDAHAATLHGHPDLAAHDTLGLATQAELDAHTTLAAHQTLGLATSADLTNHANAADPHSVYLTTVDHDTISHAHNHDGVYASLTAGLVPSSQLGVGTASAQTALHGDGTWKIAATPGFARHFTLMGV